MAIVWMDVVKAINNTYSNLASNLLATNVQDAIDELQLKKAPLDSPSFINIPTAPTASIGTDTTQIATTSFVLANGGSGGNDYTIDGGRPDSVYTPQQSFDGGTP